MNKFIALVVVVCILTSCRNGTDNINFDALLPTQTPAVHSQFTERFQYLDENEITYFFNSGLVTELPEEEIFENRLRTKIQVKLYIGQYLVWKFQDKYAGIEIDQHGVATFAETTAINHRNQQIICGGNACGVYEIVGFDGQTPETESYYLITAYTNHPDSYVPYINYPAVKTMLGHAEIPQTNGNLIAIDTTETGDVASVTISLENMEYVNWHMPKGFHTLQYTGTNDMPVVSTCNLVETTTGSEVSIICDDQYAGHYSITEEQTALVVIYSE